MKLSKYNMKNDITHVIYHKYTDDKKKTMHNNSYILSHYKCDKS